MHSTDTSQAPAQRWPLKGGPWVGLHQMGWYLGSLRKKQSHLRRPAISQAGPPPPPPDASENERPTFRREGIREALSSESGVTDGGRREGHTEDRESRHSPQVRDSISPRNDPSPVTAGPNRMGKPTSVTLSPYSQVFRHHRCASTLNTTAHTVRDHLTPKSSQSKTTH